MPESYRKHLITKYYERVLGLYGSGKVERREDNDVIEFVLTENKTCILRIAKDNIHRQIIATKFNEEVLPAAFNYQKKLLIENCPQMFIPVKSTLQNNLENCLTFEDIGRVKKRETLVRCLQALNTYIEKLASNMMVGNTLVNYTQGGRQLYYKMLCKEAKKLHHQHMKPVSIALMAFGILCAVAAICIAAVNIGFILSGIFAPLSPILFGASAGLGVVGIGLFAKGAYNFAQYRKTPEKTQTELQFIKNSILHPLKI